MLLLLMLLPLMAVESFTGLNHPCQGFAWGQWVEATRMPAAAALLAVEEPSRMVLVQVPLLGLRTPRKVDSRGMGAAALGSLWSGAAPA
jgi:hypothetical protein